MDSRANPQFEPTTLQPAEAPSSALAGIIWFVVFTTVGVAAVAAGVLLPEVAALAELEDRRDGLAHQLRCERKLSRYNDRLIGALESDPVLKARLMMRYGNYTPAGCREIEMDAAPVDDSPPARIMRQAAHPPAPRGGPLLKAGRWLRHRPTRTGLILLGLGTLCLGMILFIGRSRP